MRNLFLRWALALTLVEGFGLALIHPHLEHLPCCGRWQRRPVWVLGL